MSRTHRTLRDLGWYWEYPGWWGSAQTDDISMALSAADHDDDVRVGDDVYVTPLDAGGHDLSDAAWRVTWAELTAVTARTWLHMRWASARRLLDELNAPDHEPCGYDCPVFEAGRA